MLTTYLTNKGSPWPNFPLKDRNYQHKYIICSDPQKNWLDNGLEPTNSSLIWKRWTLKTLRNHRKGITFKDGRCRWILVDSWSSYVGHLRSSSNDPQLATHRFQDARRQHVRSVPVCSSTFIQHLQTTTKKEREGGLVTLPYSLASDIHKHGSYENRPSWGQRDIVGRCVVGV